MANGACYPEVGRDDGVGDALEVEARMRRPCRAMATDGQIHQEHIYLYIS
jgi:hypothetical protein